MEEMRVQIEAREPTDGEIRAFWFTLPIDTEQVEELLGIDIDTDYYRLPVLYDCVLTDSVLCGYLHEAGRPYEYVQLKCWGQPEHGTQDIPSPLSVHATQG